MPELSEAEVVRRAHQDAAEGKSPSTQAGEFVREEIEHVREGIHGARNIKQAIAIGLSKARRAGVKLPPPRKGTASACNPSELNSRRVEKARGVVRGLTGVPTLASGRSISCAICVPPSFATNSLFASRRLSHYSQAFRLLASA